MNSEDVVPPLAANMNAAFKKVRGAIGGAADTDLADLIVERIVELAKDGVYDTCSHRSWNNARQRAQCRCSLLHD